MGRVVSAVSHDAAVTAHDDVGLPERSVSASRSRGWLMRRLLLGADIVGLVAAYGIALVLAPPGGEQDAIVPAWEVVLFATTLPLWLLLFHVHGLYDHDEERADHSTVDDVVGVFQALTLGTWCYLVVANVLDVPHPTLTRLVVFWLIAVALIPLLRALSRLIGRRQAAYMQNVIIVGSGHVAQLLAEKIGNHPEYGLNVVGFVDRDNLASVGSRNGKRELIGTTEDLPRLVKQLGVHRVVIAFSTDSHQRTLQVIRSVQGSDVQVEIVPRMFEILGTNAKLHTVEGLPLVGLPSPDLSPSAKFLKRSFDLVVGTCGVLLISPLLAVVAVAIKVDSRGPVFFRQVRMGADSRPFRVLKFRTMVKDAEAQKPSIAHLNMHNGSDSRMFKVPDDPRVTRVGRVLRRWRIDELPQLFDVIRGRMSLVGPRPADPRRGPARGRLGSAASRPEARDDRSLAGARRERHPVRRDDEARLPLRDELVVARRLPFDAADAPRAHEGPLGVLTAARVRNARVVKDVPGPAYQRVAV